MDRSKKHHWIGAEKSPVDCYIKFKRENSKGKLKSLLYHYKKLSICCNFFFIDPQTGRTEEDLWLIWVPRRLDIVSSKFCLKSAMFLTVLILLVSGSSPRKVTQSFVIHVIYFVYVYMSSFYQN